MSQRFTKGTAPKRSCLRISTSSSDGSCLVATRADSSRARARLTSLEAPVPAAAKRSAVTPKTPKNTKTIRESINVYPWVASMHFQFCFEQFAGQQYAGNPQSIEKFRSNAARLEGADHVSVRPNPFAQE